MNRIVIRRLTALAAGLLAACAAHAQLFKCVTKAGKVVYQDSACEDTAKQSTLRAPAASPAPEPAAAAKAAPAKAAAPTPPAGGGSALEVVAGYTICAERVPNFAFKYSEAYAGWRTRNAALVARLSSEPDASRLDERLRTERARPASESIAERCADVATTMQPPATAAK
jgi:hypothetical protein